MKVKNINQIPPPNIILATWQSIYEQDMEYFEQFDVIIGDEAHMFKAKSLEGIMEKSIHTKYRYGFTGTLDDMAVHHCMLEGLFGSVVKVIKSAEMIEQGYASPVKINIKVLEWPEMFRHSVIEMKYQEEIEWLVKNKARNDFIVDLVNGLKGHTLVLFQFVKGHGDQLFEQIKTTCKQKDCYYIHGGVEGDDRETIRKIVISATRDTVIAATYGTFQTGMNVPNLDNIVFAHPSKGKIRVLQSIGRGLRKSEAKTLCTVYDIVDDLRTDGEKNYAYRHYESRREIYQRERFPFEISPCRIER